MLLAILRIVGSTRTQATAPHPATAEELVAGVRRRDARAERELVARGGSLAAGVLVNIVGRAADHDDLVQETLVRVFQRLDQLEEPKALFGFVRTVAVNVAREALRTKRRQWWWRLSSASEVPDHAGPDPTEGRLELAALERAIAKLDAEPRVAFGLRYLEGLSGEEAAAAMGVSLGTMKRRLADAERAVAEACPALGLSTKEALR